MAEHTPTPWRYRPREFDDWGYIRGPDDDLVAVAKDGKYHTAFELDEHRINGTDPAGHNAAFIVKAVNDHDDLMAQVKVLREALEKIAAIKDQYYGPDWEEIEEARKIATTALSSSERGTQ